MRGGTALPLALLAAAGFLSASGARIVDPLIALIARDFHTTVPGVSILIAAFVLPYGLNQVILGPVGDRYGKLRVLLGALVGYAAFMTACALAGGLATLTVLRACAGASSAGLIPVCLAYIGDAVPYDERQATVSRFLGGVVLAQTLAGPLGGVFADYVGWRAVFALFGFCGAAVAASLALRIRRLPDRRGQFTFGWHNYMALARAPVARELLIATVVEGALLPGAFPFIAPYLTVHFGLSYALVGLVLACFGIGAYAYTRQAKTLIAQLGEEGQVLMGGTLIAVVIATGMASPRWTTFIVVQAAIGLGYFALHTVLQARATELLPDARSTAVSTFVLLLFLGQALGALAMGAAIGWVGYRLAFLGDAAATALLTAWLFLFIRRTSQQPLDAAGLVANRSRQAP